MGKTVKRKTSARTKTIKAQIPEQVYRQLDRLVTEGWFKSQEDVVEEALRRFLSTHQPELMEQFLREDVEWGLRGEEKTTGGRRLRRGSSYSSR